MKEKFLYTFMFLLGGVIGCLIVCYYRPAPETINIAQLGQSNTEGVTIPCKDTIQMQWPSELYKVNDTIYGSGGYFVNENCDYKMIYIRKHWHIDSTWAVFVKL